MFNTPETKAALREKIWGHLPLYSHSPEPCTAKAPCELCGRSLNAILALLQSEIEVLATEARIAAYKYIESLSNKSGTISTKKVIGTRKLNEASLAGLVYSQEENK